MTTGGAGYDLSVVVSTHDRPLQLREAIAAIRAQDHPGPIETIVVDDGCPENSGDIAERHALHPRVVRQNNGGVSAARNRGIAEASGTYLAFLDADDRWHPRKLAVQIERLRAQGVAAFCFTRFRMAHGDGQPGDDSLHPSSTLQPSLRVLARNNFVGCSTVVVDRSCVQKVGGFPDSEALRKGGQDYALWLRIATVAPLVFVPEVLVDYWVHPTSRVGSDAVKNFEGAVFALQSFRAWNEQQFEVWTGSTYRALVGRRGLSMMQALWRGRRLDRRMWAKAMRSWARALIES